MLSAMTPKNRVLIEVAAFVALALISKRLADPFFWRYSGPVTLIFTLVVLTIYLRHAGLGWRALGLVTRPTAKSRWLVLPQTALAFVAILGTGLAVGLAGEASGLAFMQPDAEAVDDRWGDLAGNLPLYLLWMTLTLVAAFAEEMFFRGYLVSRLRTGFDRFRFGPGLAVLVAASIFGYGHVYYQGLRGFFVTGSIGLVLGVLFLLYRRNLWPLIAAHALVNALGFTARFMQWDI